MDIKVIAVVGAGIMGCDIALELASYQYSVILKDLTNDVLNQAKNNIRKNFKLFKLMKSDQFTQSVDEYLDRIKFATDYKSFSEIDMVIENITEDLNAKESVYQELRKVCTKDVIFGVNTSCISITTIGSFLLYPEKVIGMHFLNPVPMKNFVEIIKGIHTSENTLNITQNFLKSIKKTWIVVNDSPGFVTNRVLMLMINECIYLVQEQIAEPKDIDKVFRLGFGHKMGPLATADLIGLDTILNSLDVLHQSYKDPKFRPCPLLRKMVHGRILGKKTGKGFFDY